MLDWARQQGLIPDTREYLLGLSRIGSFEQCTYNYTELPTHELKRQVFRLLQSVDMSYHLRRGEYGPYVKRLLTRVAGECFYALPPQARGPPRTWPSGTRPAGGTSVR